MVDLTPAFEAAQDAYLSVDDINALSARLYALNKDCPGKTWWDADPMHPAICRALRIDPQEEGAVFAKAPFRLAKIDDRHVILAAYPAPRLLGPVDGEWLNIEAVVAWDPRTDEASVLGDLEPQLIGATAEGTIFGSARAFFTAWLHARAAFFVRWIASRKGDWAHGAIEHDLAPGALAVGPIDAIQWNPSALPAELRAVAIDPAKLNRALLKAARIPRAYAANPMKAVA